MSDDREKLEPVLVRMSPLLHSQIKEQAAMEDRTMAMVIRRACAQYIGRALADELAVEPSARPTTPTKEQ